MYEMQKYNLTKGLLWRFIRSALSVLIAGVASIYFDNPYYLAIAPLIQVADKWLRSKN